MCSCGDVYRCKGCGRCLPCTHERVLRIGETNPSRKFYVDPRDTFVNPGWNDTAIGEDEWWWYFPVRQNGKLTMLADCWVRATP